MQNGNGRKTAGRSLLASYNSFSAVFTGEEKLTVSELFELVHKCIIKVDIAALFLYFVNIVSQRALRSVYPCYLRIILQAHLCCGTSENSSCLDVILSIDTHGVIEPAYDDRT